MRRGRTAQNDSGVKEASRMGDMGVATPVSDRCRRNSPWAVSRKKRPRIKGGQGSAKVIVL